MIWLEALPCAPPEARRSMGYLAILLIVMVLMNTYPLVVSEDLVFQSKCASLLSAAASLNTAVSGFPGCRPAGGFSSGAQ